MNQVQKKGPEKVPFEVYRGESEKVTNTHITELRLFKDNIEVLMSYDYQYTIETNNPDNEQGVENLTIEDICRMRAIMSKDGLSIHESVTYHQSDFDREYPVYLIILEKNGNRNDIWIRCKKEESTRLYKILRKWILASNV